MNYEEGSSVHLVLNGRPQEQNLPVQMHVSLNGHRASVHLNHLLGFWGFNVVL